MVTALTSSACSNIMFYSHLKAMALHLAHRNKLPHVHLYWMSPLRCWIYCISRFHLPQTAFHYLASCNTLINLFMQIANYFFMNGFPTQHIPKESISANEIVRSTIHGIMLDRATGLLYINDHAEKSLLKKKQRAVLYGDWLLARQSPDTMVLVNIKDGQWTTDWHSSLAKRAPLQKLL